MQRHTDSSAVATAGTRAGSPVLEAYQAHSAIPAGCPPTRQIGDPLAAASSSGTEEVARGQIWRVRRMRICGNVVVGENSVRGCVVIMEQPIARAPQFRSFSPNVLPQTAKNTAVELGVHGLALGDRFMVHNPSNVKKHEHGFERAAALPRLLRSWGSWTLPLRRLLFSLGIIPVDPTLVPSNNPLHEGWVIQGTLTKLFTNCNTVLFLFGGQKPGHELFSNAVHVQIARENCLHCSV